MQRQEINTRYGIIEWFPNEQWSSECNSLFAPLLEQLGAEDSPGKRLFIEQAGGILKDLVISGFQDVLEQSIREFEAWVEAGDDKAKKVKAKKKAAKCAYDASLKRLDPISFRRKQFSFDEYFDNLSAAEETIMKAIRELLNRPQPIKPTQDNIATQLGWGSTSMGKDNDTGGRMVRRFCRTKRVRLKNLIERVKAEQKPD